LEVYLNIGQPQVPSHLPPVAAVDVSYLSLPLPRRAAGASSGLERARELLSGPAASRHQRAQRVDELQQAVQQYRNEMLKTWEEFPPFLISSVITNLGRQDILDDITALISEN
jgi:hypothetical protein